MGAIATLLSLLGSWIPSLWGDEAASVLSAQRSVPSLLGMLRHVDAVHGTYYLALHWWVAVFGPSPFSVRVPSAIAVGLGAVAVVHLAARLSGRRTALFAGLVYCLLPRVTYMGEEARAYALDAALAAWLLVLLVDLVQRRRTSRRAWVVYAVLLALGVYLFLYLALFVVVHGVVLLAARVPRTVWRRWLIATVAAMAAASPVIAVSISERAQVAFLANRNTTGFTSLAVGLWFSTWWVALVAWALIAVAVVAWARRLLLPAADRREHLSSPSIEAVTFAWLLIPGGLLLLSTLIVADFSGRYLSMCAPAAALAVGIGLERLASRRVALGITAAVVVLASCVPVYAAQRTPYAKNQSDWAEISATISEHSEPGQAVVFDETIKPSKRPRLAYRTYPAGFRGLDDVALAVPYDQAPTWHDETLTVSQAVSRRRLVGHSTVWLIEYATPSHVDVYGRSALESDGYSIVASYRTHRSVIYRLVHGAPLKR
ncbi:glycosyltransferase family 39 protein [Frondihabitans peucedani]|uniref:Glycosyltransferase family 39 protein n=1 Tax=Frondihabitans peucedani TaxID=598626 RepID=A0ABP8E584_9MICO